MQGLEDNIKKSKERLIAATRNSTDNLIKERTITRKQKWEEKQLGVYFKRQIEEISQEKSWTWLRKGKLKRETESPVIEAQNNAIRTMLKRK